MTGRTDLRHDWSVTPGEAVAIQKRLRAHLVIRDEIPPVRRVAGVDVGFENHGRTTRAATAVLDPTTLALSESAVARRPTDFPYVPGMLSFREIPAILAALTALTAPPDLLICDGHGIAHPRRLGIAAHLGLVTDIPSIGVGKSRLCGTHQPVPAARHAHTDLTDGAETIGTVLRSRERVQPIFVSPGHRVGLNTALVWVQRCLTRFRLPETTRAADHLAGNAK